MFLDILEFRVENKKKHCLGKTVYKCGLRFVEKWPLCPQNYFQKKLQKKKKKIDEDSGDITSFSC